MERLKTEIKNYCAEEMIEICAYHNSEALKCKMRKIISEYQENGWKVKDIFRHKAFLCLKFEQSFSGEIEQ